MLWTAVLGVLAVGSGVIVGNYSSLTSVLLLACIFGCAQHTITRFLDSRAADIVGGEKLPGPVQQPDEGLDKEEPWARP